MDTSFRVTPTLISDSHCATRSVGIGSGWMTWRLTRTASPTVAAESRGESETKLSAGAAVEFLGRGGRAKPRTRETADRRNTPAIAPRGQLLTGSRRTIAICSAGTSNAKSISLAVLLYGT